MTCRDEAAVDAGHLGEDPRTGRNNRWPRTGAAWSDITIGESLKRPIAIGTQSASAVGSMTGFALSTPSWGLSGAAAATHRDPARKA
jgi:hypothetical protein